MNAISGKRLLVTIAAIALVGASGAARADDMAGMKIDKGQMEKTEKTDKKAKEPTADASGAKAKKGAEKLDVAITDKGFEPDKLEVKKGQPVEIVFTRKTDQTCIKEVILDTGTTKIQKPLPLNKPVVIKTKFTKAGDLKYVCNMNMYSGTVKVQ
jgi:plastocyanin domain-containing protein